MRKKFVVSLLVFMSVCCVESRAQYLPPVFAIHITSPWGFVFKGGIKFEYRIYETNALLLSYTDYYSVYPGFQSALEYRIYFHTKTLTENLIYTKIGTGFAGYQPSSLYTDNNAQDKAPGTYYFGGAGVGKHFNFGHFFFEITAGLKFSYVAKPPAQYNETLFYTLGPGAIPDINLHFGLQF